MIPTSLIQYATLLPLLLVGVSARPQLSTVASGFSPAATGVSTAATSGPICNNSPSLCQRSYGNVTFLGAHDSPFLRDQSTGFSSSGNQFYNSTVQLSAGVRLLTAQVHAAKSSNGAQEWHLCHSSCDLLDAGRLSNWLAEIRTWMDRNPTDVVTLVLVNDGATASDLAGEFTASGITKYAYTPNSLTTPPSSPSSWPTLQALIQANKRLVTFVASLPASSNTVAPYLMDEFNFVFENPFEVTSRTNFSCLPDRPSAVRGSPQAAVQSGRLFMQNHFLAQAQAFGIVVPDVGNLTNTNSPNPDVSGSLGGAVSKCSQTYGRAPNFVLVDFFNVGPAISTIDSLNGVSGQTRGRTTVSEAVLQRSTTSKAASERQGGGSWAALAIVGVVVGMMGW